MAESGMVYPCIVEVVGESDVDISGIGVYSASSGSMYGMMEGDVAG